MPEPLSSSSKRVYTLTAYLISQIIQKRRGKNNLGRSQWGGGGGAGGGMSMLTDSMVFFWDPSLSTLVFFSVQIGKGNWRKIAYALIAILYQGLNKH